MFKFKFENGKKGFALLLIAIFAFSLIIESALMTSAQIALPSPQRTIGYVTVAPKVIGVGQLATVTLFVVPVPTSAGLLAYFGGPNNGSYSGITVSFTKPDGSKDTFSPIDGSGQYPAGVMNSLGSMYFLYEPNMAGSWSATMQMPQQNFTDSTGTTIYTECTSQPIYFNVTTEPQLAGMLNGYPWSELPNSDAYWTWPINSNNRDWAAIAGDWLPPGLGSSLNFMVNSGGYWQPYGSGPETSHILWKLPYMDGGIVGGEKGAVSRSAWLVSGHPVIMNGKAYINIVTDQYPASSNKFECIDIATGKILWTAPGTISTGIYLPGNAAIQSSATNQVTLAGSFGSAPQSYLFGNMGNVWNYYDPNTGALLFSFTNATQSTICMVNDSPIVFGNYVSNTVRIGTPLQVVNGVNPTNIIFKWNMSKVVGGDWQTGLEWTHSVNDVTTLTPGPGDGSGRYSIAVSPDLSTFVYIGCNMFQGFSTTDGRSIWNVTSNYVNTQIFANVFKKSYFLGFDSTTATIYCYDDLTGALRWSTPNIGLSPWNTRISGYVSTNDENNLYVGGVDGVITALSLADGHIVWQSEPFDSTEYPQNVLPQSNWGITTVGGNVYALFAGETFYQMNPILRFGKLVCFNATTGTITWTDNNAVVPQGMVDRYLMGGSLYDANYYCFSKGQTTTTVTAQQQIGGSLLIQGSVMDNSPAQANTPAISDTNMTVWMDYLHNQNATLLNNPPQCNGVPVTLTAVDPNGNAIPIGTATSNYQGNYGLQWTPTMPGLYTIFATFEGSNSYYPSLTSTFATVATASSTPTPSSTTGSVSNSDVVTYLILGVIAIIISIAIVGILLFRKKA